ncbi:molybdopterin-guanine dinucleotide biosynthesis protein B [Scopulibacillus daqui]|uniref:Molybdopterin-guanine dinucleotide biosynthesis protein B n=1 Tax=Scopulibacillus daqui TaxID=1469162 RepID=A0ABS2PVP6_9BACL|nr:molybdopterin-guanine dinucleotide biosynthesis protein B [Scopulibacillus daqui]MBM7644006.1 molybdopterin-guanine dinucleotide biosynthesis protein B [Scopulibacillus daqui]
MNVWQVAGYHNSGKTTFITQLLPRLKMAGCRVATIKHHGHHEALQTVCKGETDTGKHFESGADAVAYALSTGFSVVSRQPFSVKDLVAFYQMSGRYDVILIEGFKQADYPKIVFHRGEEDDHLIEQLNHIQAVVTHQETEALARKTSLPVFSANDFEELISMVLSRLGGRHNGEII